LVVDKVRQVGFCSKEPTGEREVQREMEAELIKKSQRIEEKAVVLP